MCESKGKSITLSEWITCKEWRTSGFCFSDSDICMWPYGFNSCTKSCFTGSHLNFHPSMGLCVDNRIWINQRSAILAFFHSATERHGCRLYFMIKKGICALLSFSSHSSACVPESLTLPVVFFQALQDHRQVAKIKPFLCSQELGGVIFQQVKSSKSQWHYFRP